jgi:hypothetical protein
LCRNYEDCSEKCGRWDNGKLKVHPRYRWIKGVNFRREVQSEEKEDLSKHYVINEI